MQVCVEHTVSTLAKDYMKKKCSGFTYECVQLTIGLYSWFQQFLDVWVVDSNSSSKIEDPGSGPWIHGHLAGALGWIQDLGFNNFSRQCVFKLNWWGGGGSVVQGLILMSSPIRVKELIWSQGSPLPLLNLLIKKDTPLTISWCVELLISTVPARSRIQDPRSMGVDPGC